MTKTYSYYLPEKAAKALLKRRVGKLSLKVTEQQAPERFRLIDTFDGEVRLGARLLFEINNHIMLLSETMGPLQQTSARKDGHVAGFDAGVVKAALADVSDLRALLTVGSGSLETLRLALVDGEHKTRARMALRWMRADGGGTVAIVELQGLRGYDKALETLNRQVAAQGGKTLAHPGIYTTLFPNRPLYIAKPDIILGERDRAYQTATHIIRTYLPVARANEAGIVDDIDIEFLHDYRIALRKIRSVLSLFSGVYAEDASDALKARFSDLMAPTGTLRDLDVYLADKERYFALLPAPLHGGLELLFAEFERRRGDAHVQLSRHLQSKAYANEVASLAALFAKKPKIKSGRHADLPALDYSSALIWKRYRKVCKIAAGINDKTEDEEVHRLRIQCKKLRYLMEFFAPVFPKQPFKGVLRPLKQLQDNLGLFNDYSVQQDSLRALLDDLSGDGAEGRLEIAQSVGALIVVLHRMQRGERAKVVSSFARFNDTTTTETFRTLFHTEKVPA